MDFTFEVFANTRRFFKNFLENTSLENLNKIPKGFNNNVIWNIGHIVVTEQLLAYKLSGLPTTVSEELINKYRKDTKPEGSVNQEEVDEIKALLFLTIKKTEADYKNNIFENYNAYTVSTTGNTLTNIDEALQFILFHEAIHFGYVLALLRALKA